MACNSCTVKEVRHKLDRSLPRPVIFGSDIYVFKPASYIPLSSVKIIIALYNRGNQTIKAIWKQVHPGKTAAIFGNVIFLTCQRISLLHVCIIFPYPGLTEKYFRARFVALVPRVAEIETKQVGYMEDDWCLQVMQCSSMRYKNKVKFIKFH